MCDGALKAAETAVSLGERIMHLEKACEYAKMAAAERKRSNVYEIISHGR
jgi:hypothetical protein